MVDYFCCSPLRALIQDCSCKGLPRCASLAYSRRDTRAHIARSRLAPSCTFACPRDLLSSEELSREVQQREALRQLSCSLRARCSQLFEPNPRSAEPRETRIPMREESPSAAPQPAFALVATVLPVQSVQNSLGPTEFCTAVLLSKPCIQPRASVGLSAARRYATKLLRGCAALQTPLLVLPSLTVAQP